MPLFKSVKNITVYSIFIIFISPIYFHTNPPWDFLFFGLIFFALVAVKLNSMVENTVNRVDTPTLSKLKTNLLILLITPLIAFFAFYSLKKGFVVKIPYINSVALIFASIAILYWRQAYDCMGNNFADKVCRPENLLTSGPFAIVRNPLYLSYFILYPSLLLYSIMVIHPSLIFITLLLGVVFLLWLTYFFIKRMVLEEQILLDFGDKYIEYKNNTPKIFPTLGGLKEFMDQLFLPASRN